MGYYTEYLNAPVTSFEELTRLRKEQLQAISKERNGNDVLVFAADLEKGRSPIGICYQDLLPIEDQLTFLNGDKLDLILETPGGVGEVAEDIIRILREKYSTISVIILGRAMSAGTLMAMAADEILMDRMSSLGPIDAQLNVNGKVFSADALIEGFESIKKDVDKNKSLNLAYVPMLQNLSPGELQHAQNALDFAKDLVETWLVKHKFKNWSIHSSNGEPVTEEDRKQRAYDIAKKLGAHQQWKTHGRSIKINDLRDMRLLITDYSENKNLYEAIRKYYALMQMSLQQAGIYKIFETAHSQIYRFAGQQIAPQSADSAQFDLECPKCKNQVKVQANLKSGVPIQQGCIIFPMDNKLKCSVCNVEIDLTAARRELEAQTKRNIVFN